jgi:hypothetical protein
MNIGYRNVIGHRNNLHMSSTIMWHCFPHVTATETWSWSLIMYYSWPTRMALTLTAWVGSHISGLTLQRKHRSCQEHKLLLLHILLYQGLRAIAVQYITSVKQKACTTDTRWSTTWNNSVNSHTQDTTALNTTVCVTWVHGLLVTNILLLPAEPPPKSELLYVDSRSTMRRVLSHVTDKPEA